MKLKKLTALLCVLCLAASLLVPAGAAAAPASSSNIGEHNYITWADTVKSHLYENNIGGVTRVEYINGTIVVEDYDGYFELVSSRTIPMELSIWGGFFHGANGNYFVFGQTNLAESDSTEVIRVVKYSHDWQRLGSDSLYGANTTVPFDAGSLRFAEYGGMLYVRTSHEMYTADDGYNHQANLTLSFNESTMKITDSYYIVMNPSVGYVSHSFNQFILVDSEQNIITVDHGDAYPRSIVLMQYAQKAGGSTFTGRTTAVDIQTFPGYIGQNMTGAAVGGLAETSSGYLTAYAYDGQGGNGARGVYLAHTAKGSLVTSTQLVCADASAAPMLVPTSLYDGYILWNIDTNQMVFDTLCYARYYADGSIGAVMTANIPAPLSDCQPINVGGRCVWYTTYSGTPTFYILDDSGVTAYTAGGGATPDPDPTPTPTPTPTPDPDPEPGKATIYYYVDGMLAMTVTTDIGNDYTEDHVVKDGYEFLGWYTAEVGGTRYGAGDIITETSPRVLYAQYAPLEEVTIYYYIGDELYMEQEAKLGDSYLSYARSESGYRFLGWFSSPTGGVQYDEDDVITETSPRVLYARYERIAPEEVTINYYVDGSLYLAHQTTVGGAYADLRPVKAGYEFLGWYPTASGGTSYDSSDLVTETSPRSLYARFEPIEEPVRSIILQIGNPLIYVDGEPQNIDFAGTVPVIRDDRTLLPVRAVVEAMGGTVGWDAQRRIVILTIDGETLYLQIDEIMCWDGSGNYYRLDTEPVIINSRTMLPIRFIVEFFGGGVEWDGVTQTVVISC